MDSKANKSKWILLVGSALLVILLAGGGLLYYVNHYQKSGKISIDVNPGIELEYNNKEQVLSCTAVDGEGVTVLDDLNGGKTLEGMSLQVAVNSLVGSLERHGYFSGANPSILITVCEDKQNHADMLAQELKSSVSVLLYERAPSTSVLTQVIRFDDWRDQKSKAHLLTQGKGALISRIREKNADLDYEKLSGLTASELVALLDAGAPSMPVGRSAAYSAALSYAGLTADQAVLSQVTLRFNEDPAVYETVLMLNDETEETYHVSAYSGQVLDGKTNLINNGQESDVTPINATTDIGAEAAKTLALRRADADAGDVSNLTIQRKLYDGLPAYEIAFTYDGLTYNYTIDGTDGSLIKYQTSDAKGTVISRGGSEKTSVGGSTGGNSSTGGNTGTGTGNNTSTGGNTGSSGGSSNTGSSTGSSSGGSTTENVLNISKAKAVAVAAKDYDDTNIDNTSVNETTYNGKSVYEVGFKKNNTWTYYYVDAQSGDIVKKWTQNGKTDTGSSTEDSMVSLFSVLGLDPDKVSNLDVNGTDVSFDYNGQHYNVDRNTGKIKKIADIVIDGADDYIPTDTEEETDIGAERAKEIALENAGLTKDEVKNLSASKLLGNRYKVKFETLTTKYEYKIDGATGSILESESENA